MYRYPAQKGMIRSFRHRGLKCMYNRGDARRVAPGLAGRVAVALADLDDACSPMDLDLPGYRLHPLKGSLKGVLEHLDFRKLADDLSLQGRQCL